MSKEYTVGELEDLAFQGVELPEDLNYGEILMFLMFRNLYDFARRSQMDPVQGKREKQRIMMQCKKYLIDAEYVRYVAGKEQRTESACRNYRKNPCPETADKLLEAIEGVGR